SDSEFTVPYRRHAALTTSPRSRGSLIAATAGCSAMRPNSTPPSRPASPRSCAARPAWLRDCGGAGIVGMGRVYPVRPGARAVRGHRFEPGTGARRRLLCGRMGQRLMGVDVGGTKVSVAVLEDGRLSDPQITPTDLSSSDALVEQLIEGNESAGPATAVGIGVPSVVDFATGTARSSVNIPLQGVPLRHAL